PPCQRIETSSPPGLRCQIWVGSLTLTLAWSQLLDAHSGTDGIVAPFCATSPVQNLAGPSESRVISDGAAPTAASGLTSRPSIGTNAAATTSGHRRGRRDIDECDIFSVCRPDTS